MKKNKVFKNKVKAVIEKQRANLIAIVTSLSIFILTSQTVYADSNTGSIDGFITFVCDWLLKIGGVVALVGGVMFALGWQREDAENKSRGLLTMMAGFMVIALSQSKGLFGL